MTTIKTYIDTLLDEKVRPGSPGAAVALIQHSEIVHAKGYGLANLEWDIPIATNTVFRIASITKQFTTVALMRLVEQDKLSVDDPLTRFFPDYPTNGQQITVHHLLTHTSGIFSYTDDPEFGLKKMRFDRTPEQLLQEFSRVPFDFAPGTDYHYNNSAYILLGLIIEQVSGMSYADYLHREIFQPLGMTQSCYLHNEPIVPHRASGYVPARNDTFENMGFLSMTQPYAAGAIGSTVIDLARWDKALDENKLISAATLRKMQTSATLNDGTPTGYGYGWFVDGFFGHRVVFHPGGITGFSTIMVKFPEDEMTIIVLANRENFPAESVAASIARHVLAISAPEPDSFRVAPAQLEKYAGRYFIGAYKAEIEIWVEDGQLLSNRPHPERMAAVSETQFYNGEFDRLMIFSDERDGQFSKVVIRSGFMSVTGQRVAETNP